jgi:hypothetical protein
MRCSFFVVLVKLMTGLTTRIICFFQPTENICHICGIADNKEGHQQLITANVFSSYRRKNCNIVRLVTAWPTEPEVKLTDNTAVVTLLARPVCVWTVNLSGASQGGAPGLASTPSPTRHFILSSSAHLYLSRRFSTTSNVAGSNCLPHSFNLSNETRSDPIKW